MIEIARKMRDKALRRRILSVAENAKIGPLGGIGGRSLMNVVNASSPRDERLADDGEFLSLVRDLANAGYLIERDERTHRHQNFVLDQLFFKVTAKGSALLREEIGVDPMVADERIGGNE